MTERARATVADRPPVPGPAARKPTGCDVLLVIAHPDDEVFASGVLCLCAERGLRLRIVSVTDGEGGGDDLGPDARGRLAARRREELQASAAALGAQEPQFLGQPDVADPEHGPASWDRPALTDALATLIAAAAPQVILTHGPMGGYGHPAHRLTHDCVMAAAGGAAFPGAVFSFCAQVPGAFFSWHFDQPSEVRVDCRAFLERRCASLDAHRSQADYFLQPHRPRTLRKHLSALFGQAFGFSEFGRKRIPIATSARFFARFPTEGLVLQRPPAAGRAHFFIEHFENDARVQLDR